MSEAGVQVTVDDRARLVMAALGASHWPEREQAQQPHAVHQHAKQTRQFLAPFGRHEAILALNRLLDDGLSLSDLFAVALSSSWPGLEPIEPLPDSLKDGRWLAQLADFRRDSSIEVFWSEHIDAWEIARDDLAAVFRESGVVPFLNQFHHPPESRPLQVIPCIVYPMLSPVLVKTAAKLFFILPPAKAWGESPPWPFAEDPGWVIAQTCWHLTSHYLSPVLSQSDAASQTTLRHAAVTLCLEQEFDQAEAMAYLVRARKESALPRLPLAVERMRQFLDAPDQHSLLDLDFT